MDVAALEQKWNEMLKGVFESFVDSEIGRDAEKRPECFGTGDDHLYCVHCQYVNIC